MPRMPLQIKTHPRSWPQLLDWLAVAFVMRSSDGRLACMLWQRISPATADAAYRQSNQPPDRRRTGRPGGGAFARIYAALAGRFYLRSIHRPPTLLVCGGIAKAALANALDLAASA